MNAPRSANILRPCPYNKLPVFIIMRCPGLTMSFYEYGDLIIYVQNYLKGLVHAKIIKKSVILFWLLNMTI